MSDYREEIYLNSEDRYSDSSEYSIVYDERTQLSNLPLDTIIQISKNLSYDDIKAICKTSVSHRDICKSKEFWDILIYDKFTSPTIIPALSMEENYLLLLWHEGEIYRGTERVVEIKEILQGNIRDEDREYFVRCALQLGMTNAEIVAFIIQGGKSPIDFGIISFSYRERDVLVAAAENNLNTAIHQILKGKHHKEMERLFISTAEHINERGIRNIFNIIFPRNYCGTRNIDQHIIDSAFENADRNGNVYVARFLLNKGAKDYDVDLMEKYFSK